MNSRNLIGAGVLLTALTGCNDSVGATNQGPHTIPGPDASDVTIDVADVTADSRIDTEDAPNDSTEEVLEVSDTVSDAVERSGCLEGSEEFGSGRHGLTFCVPEDWSSRIEVDEREDAIVYRLAFPDSSPIAFMTIALDPVVARDGGWPDFPRGINDENSSDFCTFLEEGSGVIGPEFYDSCTTLPNIYGQPITHLSNVAHIIDFNGTPDPIDNDNFWIANHTRNRVLGAVPNGVAINDWPMLSAGHTEEASHLPEIANTLKFSGN